MIRYNEVAEESKKRIIKLLDTHGPFGPALSACAYGVLMDEKINEGLNLPVDFGDRLKYLIENKELLKALEGEIGVEMRYYTKVALEVWLYSKADEAVQTLMQQYIFMNELGLDKLEGM